MSLDATGLPELSEEIKARLQPHIDDSAAHYSANITPEQTQLANAQAHGLADPAKLQQSKDEVNKLWSDCDTNQDGLHNAEEHVAFSQAMVERQRATGGFVDDRPGRDEWYAQIWAIINDVTPGVDGITVSDWRAVIYYWMGKHHAAASQAAQQ